jgi:hypothetical protein
MSEATMAVRSGNSSTLDSPNKAQEQQPVEDSSKSSDPLILEVKSVNNQEAQESNNASRHSRKPSDDQRRCDEKSQPAMTAVPPPKMSRSYSQTYDGVFSNLCAKPEIMVLPPGNPEERDSPPVPPHSHASSLFMFMRSLIKISGQDMLHILGKRSLQISPR